VTDGRRIKVRRQARASRRVVEYYHFPFPILPAAERTPRNALGPPGRRRHAYATFAFFMASNLQPPAEPEPQLLYCPKCAVEVSDPLTCGDCSAVICRNCGTPLESADELGMG
jgi:hypothetical protein